MCEMLLVVAGCATVPHLGPPGGSPRMSLFHAFMHIATLGGGPLWQLFTVEFSPLPFRQVVEGGGAVENAWQR